MTVETIILAQGTQRRLGMQHGWKQLLRLSGCRGVTLLERTARMIVTRGSALSVGQSITVITWPEIAAAFPDLSFMGRACRFVTLPAPGNSSLKGIARYLEQSREKGSHVTHTVVLLGDVVYSWACLDAIYKLSDGHGFVGTPDISSSGGEIWGVAWHRDHDDFMMSDLCDALLRHPPFEDEYQPGQLRRWIMGWRSGDVADRVIKLARAGTYVATAAHDYTMDIDLPQHVSKLGAASEWACLDDRSHGLDWNELYRP